MAKSLLQKKFALLIFLSFWLLSSYGQMCRTEASAPPSSGHKFRTNCPGYSIYYPKGSQKTTIAINYIFLQPPVGVGKWDTVTQASCEAQINYFNIHFNNLVPPTKVIPNPPPFLNSAKIQFAFKSISKVRHPIYYSSPDFGKVVTDMNALNIVFGTNSINFGKGQADKTKNELFIIDSTANVPYSMVDSGGMVLICHEIGHCLGLNHTGPYSGFNPSGTILQPFPFNDYWWEDDSTFARPWAGGGNNLMSYCWDCSKYLSPNQIYTMHKNLLFDPIISKMVSSYGTDSTGCFSDVGNDWDVSGVDTLTGAWLDPPGNLTIKSGSDITLLGCLKMGRGAKIIVEPGARFSVTNGNITSRCWGQWEGIEVQSNVGAVQAYDPWNATMPASGIGMLRLNNASISNAVTAIKTGKTDNSGNYIQYTGGAFIFSENTKYINNTTAVKFNPYWVIGGGGNDNESYFKRDTFIVDGDYFGSNLAIAGVHIDKTNKIDFLGCYFQDTLNFSSTAINCIDGAINVKDHCTSYSGNTCTGTLTQNTFIGFKRAISLSTSQMMNMPSLIDHVIIDQIWSRFKPFPIWNRVEGGIYIANNFGSQVINCDISIVKKGTTALAPNYGLYLDNCDGYVVENNIISSYRNYRTIGVCVNNSGPGANSIYNNTITTQEQCIWAQNQNYDPLTGSGLRMNCNDFLASAYNIGVQVYPIAICAPPCTPPAQPPGGIATTQGRTDPVHPELSVRNTYAVTSCNANAENKFYIDTPNGFVVTNHGSFIGSQFHPGPQTNNSCSDSNDVKLRIAHNPPGLKPTYCQVNNMPGFSNRALAENATIHRGDILSFNSVLNTALSEEHITYLLGLIAGDESTIIDFNLVKDQFMSEPFLADTILKAILLKDDFPFLSLLEIFTKNAPVSAEVWNLVNGLGLSSGDYQTLYDLQHQDILNPRSLLESHLTMAHTELGLFNNEKIRRFFKGDSLSTEPRYDSIINIYKRNEMPNSKFKLANVYISAGMNTEAGALIDSLDLVPENEDACKLLRYSLRLTTDSTFMDSLIANTNHFDYLVALANAGAPMLEGYSKALLMSIYNHKIEEIRLSPPGEEESERKSYQQDIINQSVKEIVTDKNIRIYPNPASTSLNVEVSSSEFTYRLSITDLNGKTLLQQDCRQNCRVDLTPLLNGVYLLHLYKDDVFVSAKKIIVIK